MGTEPLDSGAVAASRDPIDVRVTTQEIGAGLMERLAAPSDGAVVAFLGVVRDATEGRQVSALHYEAYSEMAEKEMRLLAEEACRRYTITSVLIAHRVGSLQVGEVSVLVAVTSPHRAAAFDACEFLIDTLKRTVPIWKKEEFSDGTARWVDHP